MGLHRQGNRNTRVAAESQSPGVSLPKRLAQLVNPRVLEMHRLKIEEATTDSATEADRRRRYLETIVDNHLWKELKNA